MEYNGVKYKVGEGVAWKGVEKVTPKQYAEIVKGSTLKNIKESAIASGQKAKRNIYIVSLFIE
jgi:hypothetical protein